MGVRMRALVLATILLVAFSAGCATKPGDTTTSGNNSTSGNGNGTMMMKELVNETHSFAPPTGAGTKAFKVDAGYSKLNVTVTFRPGSPAPVTPVGVSQGISVKVGTVSCTLPDGPIVPGSNPAPCTKMVDVAPGDMKVEYAGQGDITSRVIVQAM